MRVDVQLARQSERMPPVTELLSRFFAATARKNPARARFYVDLADPLKGQRQIEERRKAAVARATTKATSDENKGTTDEQK